MLLLLPASLGGVPSDLAPASLRECGGASFATDGPAFGAKFSLFLNTHKLKPPFPPKLSEFNSMDVLLRLVFRGIHDRRLPATQLKACMLDQACDKDKRR